MDYLNLHLAGCRLTCGFQYPETSAYFKRFQSEEQAPQTPVVSLSQTEWEEAKEFDLAPCAHTEYSLITSNCSDALLPFDRVIVHAVALRWAGRAYLICAESGVGKSTQARFLQELRPGEFGIICGDRPILEFCPCAPTSHSERSEESAPPILVHPSPWNGKENWYGAQAAPLAGLILLERGEENRLFSVTARDAALKLYGHFIHTGWDPENVRRIAALETRMLRSVPVWKLTTHSVPASSRLLLEAVFPPQTP